jgi:hypothetical protein
MLAAVLARSDWHGESRREFDGVLLGWHVQLSKS